MKSKPLVLSVLVLWALTLSSQVLSAPSGGNGPGEPGYGFPPEGPTVGDPVAIATGHVERVTVDLFVPDRIPIQVIRTYRSADIFEKFGYGWRLNYQNRLIVSASKNQVIEITPQNTVQRFTDNLDGSFTSPKGEHGVLRKNPDGSYVITQKDGNVRFFSKPDEDHESHLDSITDPNGNILSLQYDEDSGDLISVTSPSGKKVLFQSDMHHKITSLQDPTGRQIIYKYNPFGNLTEVRKRGGVVTRYEYGDESRMRLLLAEIGPTGNAWKYDYDEDGRCKRVIDPKGASMSLLFDPEHKTTLVIDERGYKTSYVYDVDFNVVKKTDTLGNVTTSQYDYDKNLTSVTDRNGSTTAIAYDSKGNPLSVTDALGNKTTLTYSPDFNKVASITDALGNKTIVEYDERGNPTRLTDPLGNATSRRYDEKGSVIELIDAEKNKSRLAYLLDGLLQSFTDPLGRKTVFTYDTYGTLSSVTDPMGHVTVHAFDELRRETRTTDALGHVTYSLYDKTGNLIELIDAKSNKTVFEYDGLKHMTKQAYPDGSVETYIYDATSNLAKKVNAKGEEIAFRYDGLGRLVEKTAGGSTAKFSYDKEGRLLSTEGPEGVTTFVYDALGRLIQVVYPGDRKVGYEYDVLGQRTKLAYPDGSWIRYEYDATRRLTGIFDESGKALAAYEYDKMGRRTKLTYGNGTSASYQYDSASELLRLTNTLKDDSFSYAYTYDGTGNRTSVVAPEGVTQYNYDKISQLTQAVLPGKDEQVFLYDELGNRKTYKAGDAEFTYTANNLNQYTQINQDKLAYDPNGNLVSQGLWKYSYDSENRLVTATDQKGAAHYNYDSFGRRAGKEIAVASQTNRESYVYDDLNILAIYESSGNLKSKFIHGRGIDEPLLLKTRQKTFYYHLDGQTNIATLSDEAGKGAEHYHYDSGGSVKIFDSNGKSIPVSTTGNPYFYTGREFDFETGLFYLRSRYYSPEIGRFTSKDPVGITGGINLYQYVRNNPINLADPLGLGPEFGDDVLDAYYTVLLINTPLGTYFVNRSDIDNFNIPRAIGIIGRILQETGAGEAGRNVSAIGRIFDTGGDGKIYTSIVFGSGGARVGAIIGGAFGPGGAVIGGIAGGIGGSIVGGIIGGSFDSPNAGILF